MNVQKLATVRRVGMLVLITTGAFTFSLIDTCDNLAVEASRIIDPCGTFLANCAPGSFEVRNAEVGDFCVDPACSVPGQCGFGQPLGTITDLCP